MGYQIRIAKDSDLQNIGKVYSYARKFMSDHGNPDQWGNTHPSEDLLRQDIAEEKLYVVVKEEKICGVFYFAIENDPTYTKIYDGQWHGDKAYGVIHRIAGDGSKGILRTAVEFVRNKIDYLRIDTHEANYVMQSALEKQGFSKCGIIYIEDGTPRIAYDLFL